MVCGAKAELHASVHRLLCGRHASADLWAASRCSRAEQKPLWAHSAYYHEPLVRSGLRPGCLLPGTPLARRPPQDISKPSQKSYPRLLPTRTPSRQHKSYGCRSPTDPNIRSLGFIHAYVRTHIYTTVI